MKSYLLLLLSLLSLNMIVCHAQAPNQETEFQIRLLDVNSKFSEIGITFYGNFKVYFASNKSDAKSTKKLIKSINTTYEAPTNDVYEAYITENGNLENVGKLPKNTHLNNNESNPIFTSDLKTVYFTQNNIVKGKFQEDAAGNVNMKIYRASVNQNGDWKNIETLNFNGDNYSCTHPALSEDNRVLFFASNKDNPKGSSDIYWALINEDGTIEHPESMQQLNSSYRDNFPFVKDNFLYFSSDRPGGFGGLDIYRLNLTDKNALPENLGSPINSTSDDFGFIMDRENNQGYFISNRLGGYGQDDIYFFKQNTLVKPCFQTLAGVVHDSITRKPIHQAEIILSNKTHTDTFQYTTPRDGSYHFKMKCQDAWQIQVSATDYLSKSLDVDYSKFVLNQNIDILLQPIIYVKKIVDEKPPLTVVRNNKEVLNLPNVYFNLDEPTMTAEGKKTVEKAADILLEHPEYMIEFSCHTDTRASFSYNMNLSDKRVNEVLKYMYKLGVDPNRISGKGYGETQPINKCVDGVYCTEAEHMQNRRAEFVIINSKK